jgi:hypothetical protein
VKFPGFAAGRLLPAASAPESSADPCEVVRSN